MTAIVNRYKIPTPHIVLMQFQVYYSRSFDNIYHENTISLVTKSIVEARNKPSTLDRSRIVFYSGLYETSLKHLPKKEEDIKPLNKKNIKNRLDSYYNELEDMGILNEGNYPKIFRNTKEAIKYIDSISPEGVWNKNTKVSSKIGINGDRIFFNGFHILNKDFMPPRIQDLLK